MFWHKNYNFILAAVSINRERKKFQRNENSFRGPPELTTGTNCQDTQVLFVLMNSFFGELAFKLCVAKQWISRFFWLSILPHFRSELSLPLHLAFLCWIRYGVGLPVDELHWSGGKAMSRRKDMALMLTQIPSVSASPQTEQKSAAIWSPEILMLTIHTHCKQKENCIAHPAGRLFSRILFSTGFAQESCYTKSKNIRKLSQICKRNGNINSSLPIVGVHRELGNVCI